MTDLLAWAIKWRVPLEAIADLKQQFGYDDTAFTVPADGAANETQVSMLMRSEAAGLGFRMWRNNVGALEDKDGRHVRYGLANDSKAVNQKIKSADLIGCRPIQITQQMVGQVVGQFVSRESKPPGWRFTGTPRETAQLKWIELVTSLGGDARFSTGTGTF